MTITPSPLGCPPAQGLSVGSFNVHAGVDGWGRPFDVVAACRAIDADVLVVEEAWTPDDEPGLAQHVATTLGYAVVEHSLAAGRLAAPHPGADHRWMRPFDWRAGANALYLDSHRPHGPRTMGSSRYRSAVPGRWGIAILSRLPVVGQRVVDLGRLGGDRATRAAVMVELEVGTSGRAEADAEADAGATQGAGGARPTVWVVGTHMAHLSDGSPIQFLRLGRRLARILGAAPAVLAGDMNLWGPPLRALLPGWRPAVRGRTWPAWRPHSQVDHLLVRGPLTVSSGQVLTDAGSDHRPIRAQLTLRH